MAESYIGTDYTEVPDIAAVPTSPVASNIAMPTAGYGDFVAVPSTLNRHYLMIARDSLGAWVQWMSTFDDSTGIECNTPNKPLSGVSIEGTVNN